MGGVAHTMAAGIDVQPARPRQLGAGLWWVVGQGACALAAAMGVGRFVYTPILPMMQAQAGMTAKVGDHLATANYLGYLVGAVAASLLPYLARSRAVLRVSLLVLVVTLAVMPVTGSAAVWMGLRGVAGVASALIFVVASNATLARLREHAQHLIGWVYGGVGAGIAISGLLVLALGAVGTWSQAWWVSAALTLVLAVLAWRLPQPAALGADSGARSGRSATRPWFAALLASYLLEGAGYIIAGTFLVAALSHTGPDWLGRGAWVLVGLAAVPSCAGWAWLSRSASHPSLLIIALLAQAVGIALPALIPGVASAVISAVVFGATFMGITTLSISAGAHLQIPRAAALLTAGYSLGQVIGPLGVEPLLGQGYDAALLVAAVLVAAGAVAAALLRIRYPHHPQPQ